MAKTDDLIAGELGKALGNLRLERIAALSQAAVLQVSMQSLLTNEARRLENKLGPQHRRTLQLKASLQNNLRAAHALEQELQLTRIIVPEVGEEEALVHGRVVDKDGLGIDRLIVGLVDQSGAPAREIAEPATDSSGYFAIVLEPNASESVLKQHRKGIFLAVFTPRRRLLHQEVTALKLTRGARLEVVIRLDRETLTSGPSTTPTTTVVPAVVGITESEALEALKKVGLTLGERNTKVSPDQLDRVLNQSPAEGTRVDLGSSVSLVIGVQVIKVPSVVGRNLKEAKAELTKAGLIVGKISGPSASDESVVRTHDPKAEVEVPQGTAVNLAVGSPAGTEVKDIIARMAKDKTFAETGLTAAKLEKRLKNRSIETREQFASLLDSTDKDSKSNLGLPNLNAAKVFKSLLQKALGGK